MSSSRDPAPVTVLGLGPMGRAMVTTLLNAGHPVTVWNRTASRAAGLVTAGATLAPTPTDAVMASKLVILSLTDYAAMYDILGGSRQALAGRVLVNLSSDTPTASREAAAWAAEHGASFLTGGVMVPAPMVGSEAAYVYYSGPEALLREHDSVLRLLGAPRYVGQDPGLGGVPRSGHRIVGSNRSLAQMDCVAASRMIKNRRASTRAYRGSMATIAGSPAKAEGWTARDAR